MDKAVFVPAEDGVQVVNGVRGSYMLMDAINLDQAKAVISNLLALLDHATVKEDAARG